MIGVVVVGHGEVAAAMVAAAESVLGPQPQMATLAVRPEDDPDRLDARLETLIDRCDDGAGVLLLADMFGSTPSNVALRSYRPGRCELVAGFSLPTLVKALTLRLQIREPYRLAEEVVTAGRRHMATAAEFVGATEPRGG